MSTKRSFGEYGLVEDPADELEIKIWRETLRERMQARIDHERASCPGVQVESESIELRQEEGETRVVSDLVLSYPDPEGVPAEAR